jgi:hypothetical protein
MVDLKQAFEVLIGQSGVSNDLAHGDGIDGVVSRERQHPVSIGHHDMLALPGDFESRFPQCSNSGKMRNTG